MSSREVKELVELVRKDTRFRVEETTTGFRVLSPDRTIPPIHFNKKLSDMGRELENIRARLRRAGFQFPGRAAANNNTEDTAMNTRPTLHVTAPRMDGAAPPQGVLTPPAQQPVDLFAQASAQIEAAVDAMASMERAMEALAGLGATLAAIKAQGEELQKLKSTLSALLGK